MQPAAHRPCIALLGGSFDPVHNGHVALAEYFVKLFAPDLLRIIPAGNPWQKHGLQASAAHRVEMVRRAFDRQTVPVVIDTQEIERAGATYTIDTLRAVRAEVGPGSLPAVPDGRRPVAAAGHLAGLARVVRLRPSVRGFPPRLRGGCGAGAGRGRRRIRPPPRKPGADSGAAHGLAYLAPNLAVDISSTAIRSGSEDFHG